MRRFFPWAAAVLGGAGLPLLAWAGQVDEGRYGHGYMWHDGWYGMMYGPLMMILFIAIIVGIVVLVLRWLGPGRVSGRAEKSPLDILEERFARGEIDQDEFEERRRVLGG